MFHSWLAQRLRIDLKCTYRKKLIRDIQTYHWILLVLLRYYIISLFIGIIVVYGVIALLYYEFPIINLMIYISLSVLVFRHIFTFSFIVVYAVFIPITYLNYKFIEILNALSNSIECNNRLAIIKSMRCHHQARDIVRNLSYINNIVIGVIHLVIPYILILSFDLIMLPKTSLYIKIFTMAIFIISTVSIYMLNLLCASIIVTNSKAPRQIYKVFCTRRTVNLRNKLKIEQFLEQLTNEYIGFYCFNMFKFTKRSFYEYFITISFSYIYVSKFLKY